MPSYDVKSGDQSYLAAKINSTQTTGITISPMSINGTTTAWANTAGVLEVSEQSDATLKREWIYYTGTSVSATTSVATLSGVVRGIARDSSDVTSGGTGQSFAKGATVRFVTFHDLLNKKANLDRAGTFTAANTFNEDVTFDSDIILTNTDKVGLNARPLTTAERDALSSPANGGIIYNETVGQTQFREGGTWVTNAAGGSVADASTTVAGKVEEAVLSELSAGTAAGATGARLFINPSLAKKTSSGAAEGNIPLLNATPAVDVSIGGTGVVSPTSGNIILGAGASPMTLLAPSTANKVVKSDGTTWTSGFANTIFGDGSDGAPTWTSGASLNAAGEFEYTTATLPAGQTLTATAANGVLVIKTTGDVTINGTVTVSSLGGAGGVARTSNGTGNAGTAGKSYVTGWTTGGGSGGAGTAGARGGGGGGGASALSAGENGVADNDAAGGAGGVIMSANKLAFLSNFLRGVACGAGGASGGRNTSGTSGAGGIGGGALVWTIGGNLTLGADSIVSADGAAGGAAVTAGGGGGGGGGGTVIILVGGTITDAGVACSAAGGTGGAAGLGTGGAGATGKVIIYSITTGTLITS